MWGTAFMFIKAGLSEFPPIFYAAIRYYIAGGMMLLYALYDTTHWYPRGRREWTLVGISATLMYAGYHSFLYIGELATTSAVASIVVSLSPLLTSGFSRLFLPSEKITIPGFIGILLGLLGVGIIARPDPAHLLSQNVIGKFLIFLAAASFALGSVLIRQGENTLPRPTLIAWGMLLGAGLMHLISLGRGETPLPLSRNVLAWVSLLYLALIAGFIGFIIYFHLLERLGPLEINLVTYVNPLFAAVAGWLVLEEGIDVLTLIGFFVIFAGFLFIKNEELREELQLLG